MKFKVIAIANYKSSVGNKRLCQFSYWVCTGWKESIIHGLWLIGNVIHHPEDKLSSTFASVMTKVT